MKKGTLQNFMSLVKFSHTIFAMPFAFIGFFLALETTHHRFEWLTFICVILCMVFARNAAMAFNRYLDRDIDKKNPRTAVREIPSGVVGSKQALNFVVGNSLLFIACTYFINWMTLFLAPVALLVVLGYSYTKRFTSLCHLVLGLGLSLAPIGAFISVTGEFQLLPIIFSFVVLTWVSGFDIIYALQDEDFDKENKLKSIPSVVGKKNALYISKLLHGIAVLLLISAGLYADFGLFYWIGALLFTGLLLNQHFVIKRHGLKKINLAFFTLNGVASVTFAVFVLLEFWV
jgi:4-hydroxybenzoate polyprenyltransferase